MHQHDTNQAAGWPTLFFRNRHLLGLATIIILVAGVSALSSLPRLEDPIITQRNPIVLTPVPGASAERVEALVSKPIEDALAEIPEIKILETSSRDGISVVSIELQDSITRQTNEAVFSRIREQLREVSRILPAEALPPEFDEKRGAVAFTLITAVTWQAGSPPMKGMLKRHAETLADRMRNVPGTELVRVYGAPIEEFTIDLDPLALSGIGLSAESVAAIVRSADTKSPAGVLFLQNSQIALEVESIEGTAERIGAIPLIANADGSVVLLRDVAIIRRVLNEPLSAIASANSKTAVFVAARVQPNLRIDRWTADALEVVNAYDQELGKGISLEVIFEQNSYTEARLGELVSSLLLGALVVLLVVLFTMGWRSAIIVGSALPLTAAASLFVISAGGGSIQQMSVFGMIIAIGLLIDNAIVMTDEIRARMADGATAAQAVGGAVRHLFIPLLSSSLTTILAFAPILLLPGNAGDFVGSIGTSVIIAIAASFFVAIFLIASFAGLFGKSRRTASGAAWWSSGVHAPRLSSHFQSVISLALKNPIKAVLVSLIIPVLGFIAAIKSPLEFFPPTDRNMFSIRVWLAENAALQTTAKTLQLIDEDLRAMPGVRRVHWMAGGSFPSVYYNLVMNNDNTPGFGQIVVETTSASDVAPLLRRIQTDFPAAYPSAQIVANSFAQGPPVDAEIEIRVIGQDLAALREVGESIRLIVAENPRIQTTRTSMPDGTGKLVFTPDLAEIQLADWTPNRIAAELQMLLIGAPAGSILEDLELMPIRARLAGSTQNSPQDIQSIQLPAANAQWIPITALGDFDLQPSQGAINRRNRERVNTIQGFTTVDTLPIQVASDILQRINSPDAPPLPAGVRIELGGDAENQSDAVSNLTLYIPILTILTIGILVLSFNSLAIATILSAAAFLSIGFGLLATWAAGFPLSFNSIIGSLGLLGIAFNASIVVTASIRANPLAAAGDIESIVSAVMSCGRHLCSTTLTTIGGCLPLVFIIGGDFWPPLAIVLIGGVAGSTLLALFFTPALYRWCSYSP